MDIIKKEPLKFLKIFSLVYLIASVVLEAVYLFLYFYEFGSQWYYYTSSVFSMILTYVPFVLFTVYLFSCYQRDKNHSLLTEFCILYALSNIISLYSAINVEVSYYRISIGVGTMVHINNYVNIICSCITVAFAVSCFVSCVSKLKNVKATQVLSVINFTVHVLSVLFSFVYSFITKDAINGFYIVSMINWIIGIIVPIVYIVFWRYAVSLPSDLMEE